jgi:hypothetical protein
MAQRWTFEEDYIVCKFCIEKQYRDIEYELLSELVDRLVESGFERRSAPAIYKRAKDFTYLLRGWESPYAVDQVRAIYSACLARRENPLQIETINPNSNQTQASCDDDSLLYEFGLFDERLTHINRLIAIEPAAPTFRELLFEYIKRSGLSDAEVYKASYVSRDTFNHIINGRKGKKVKADDENKVNASHQTVMQLCIGLKLTYTESVRLMTSAGYAFRPDKMHDRVIAACIRENIFNMVEVNMELYERRLPLIKRPNFEGVPPERKKKKTEENKEASDQK